MRSTLYDSGINDPERVVAEFGAPPLSEEVQEAEQAASVERLRTIQGLMPLLVLQAAWVSTGLVYETTDYKPEPDNDEHLRLGVLFNSVALAATVSAVSTLIDQGVLDFGSIDE